MDFRLGEGGGGGTDAKMCLVKKFWEAKKSYFVSPVCLPVVVIYWRAFVLQLLKSGEILLWSSGS